MNDTRNTFASDSIYNLIKKCLLSPRGKYTRGREAARVREIAALIRGERNPSTGTTGTSRCAPISFGARKLPDTIRTLAGCVVVRQPRCGCLGRLGCISPRPVD